MIVGYLSQKMFMASIIKKIYHIRNYSNLKREAKRHPVSINHSIQDQDGSVMTHHGNGGVKGRIVPNMTNYTLNDSEVETGSRNPTDTVQMEKRELEWVKDKEA